MKPIVQRPRGRYCDIVNEQSKGDIIVYRSEDGELKTEATVRKIRTVQQEGDRQVSREIVHYSLGMVIAIGCRVRTLVGAQFRKWATALLKEYMQKGFTLDDERLIGSTRRAAPFSCGRSLS